ncbi:MAG: CotH kinase family protein, partial [Verrucomicrobia bacterium]|nr:CotH kinase family protein [Verrucomicrobiota bacterium]
MRWLWRKLPKALWKRVLTLFGLAVGALLLLIAFLGVTFLCVRKTEWFNAWMISKFMVAEQFPKVKKDENASPRTPYTLPEPSAKALASRAQFYQPTNVWKVSLKFTEAQWKALGPNRIAPVVGWMSAGGAPVLSNTNASRNGIAGVLGIDLPWSEGAVDFGGVSFPRVGIRFKGNGTFLGAMRDYKRPFKLSLDKFEKEQRLVRCATINLGNLVADFSGISDTLGYEFFRAIGIPAPRTAFARVSLTIDGHLADQQLGLYVTVENPDAEWTTEVFGATNVALFKPVTMELFKYLGNDWTAYDRIYDPKTKVSAEQKQRVIDFAKFFTEATDADLAARLGEFLDVDETAKYIAADTLLSNYDGLLCNGQNFFLYLDPRTHKLGFIPWDLDHCWGEFPFVGTSVQREQVSIWHPWVGPNFFLERLFKLESFRAAYRRELEQMLVNHFAPERLKRRID